MFKSNEKEVVTDEEKDSSPKAFTDYMSGALYLLQKCPYCKKEITRGIEDTVTVPKIEIHINRKDDKLDKLYHIKHQITKSRTFCNVDCFMNYIKDNTSEKITSEVISFF